MAILWKSRSLIYFFILQVSLQECTACGVSTHITIAHEALHFFKTPQPSSVDYASIIHRHNDAFVAGNPYPDAFYPSICFFGWYSDVAEDSHWVPFLNASVNYIRKTYPKPWNEETEKLVAFIFGVVSHQIADVTWHSLDIQQGFIRTMAQLNFLGSYSPAHTNADFGGDMLVQFGADDEVVGISKWYVPVGDLYNIYEELYQGERSVPKAAIEFCSKLLYIEYILESLGGAAIFKPFVKKSPFLLNHLHDFFLGGIHDMASWTTMVWEEIAYMFDNGTTNCYLPKNPLFMKCRNVTSENRLLDNSTKNPGRQFSLPETRNLPNVTTLKTERGMYIYPDEEMKLSIIEHYKKSRNNHVQSNNLYSSYSDTHYSETGRSLANIKINNEAYIAVGAPNYGERGSPQVGHVLLIKVDKLLSGSGQTLEDICEFKLYGERKMSKFGWALTSMLYNNDTYEDLVVSAPVVGGEKLAYYGKVYIYYGSKFSISRKPDSTIHYEEESQYTNFGYSLSSCFSKLIIGSPFDRQQSGLVRTIDTLNGVSYDTRGHSYNWFGYSTACGVVNKTEVLLVGMPTYRLCHFKNCTFDSLDKQSIGAVDLFIHNKKYLSLTGDVEFAEFGTHISIGKPFSEDDPVLAISSPGKTINGSILNVPYVIRQAGEVTLYNLSALLQSSTVQVLARYQGDREFGRFGEQIKFADINSDSKDELIISSPRRTADITEELYGGDEGTVYIFDSKNMHAAVTNNCARSIVKPCPAETSSKVFHGGEAHARFGSSFEVVSGSNGKAIVISAPFSSKVAFHGGMLFSYEIGNIAAGNY